jgi:hypothetical protein
MKAVSTLSLTLMVACLWQHWCDENLHYFCPSQPGRQSNQDAPKTSWRPSFDHGDPNITIGIDASHALRHQRSLLVLPQLPTMLQNFQTAKSQYLDKLRHDYGAENIETLFLHQNNDQEDQVKDDAGKTTTTTSWSSGKQGFLQGTTNAELAYQRTRRKMMIRLLQYLTTGEVTDYVWATA